MSCTYCASYELQVPFIVRVANCTKDASWKHCELPVSFEKRPFCQIER